jgi:hypothetical protein
MYDERYQALVPGMWLDARGAGKRSAGEGSK